MASIKSDKLWADAVRKAVHDYHHEDENGKVKKIRYLNKLAETLVKSGIQGDMQAIKEIGDRLDGKPSQAVAHTDAEGNNLTVQVLTLADSTASE